jgi:formylglycine-generating enzyme required for sulfatase activity
MSPADGGVGALPGPLRSNVRDGTVLRLIQAGSFIMGSTAAEIEAALAMDHDGELFSLGHEMPQFRPYLRAFYIGVYTVTNLQYAQFLTMRRPPPLMTLTA